MKRSIKYTYKCRNLKHAIVCTLKRCLNSFILLDFDLKQIMKRNANMQMHKYPVHTHKLFGHFL